MHHICKKIHFNKALIDSFIINHIHNALLNISISKWVAIALGKHWDRYFEGIIPLLLEQVQHFKLLRLLQHQGEDQEVEEHQQAKEHQLYLLLQAHTCPTEDYTSISETCWTSAPALCTYSLWQLVQRLILFSILLLSLTSCNHSLTTWSSWPRWTSSSSARLDCIPESWNFLTSNGPRWTSSSDALSYIYICTINLASFCWFFSCQARDCTIFIKVIATYICDFQLDRIGKIQQKIWTRNYPYFKPTLKYWRPKYARLFSTFQIKYENCIKYSTVCKFINDRDDFIRNLLSSFSTRPLWNNGRATTGIVKQWSKDHWHCETMVKRPLWNNGQTTIVKQWLNKWLAIIQLQTTMNVLIFVICTLKSKDN